MQNITIDGIGTIQGGEYGNIEIDGIGKCTGDLTAESLSIDGKFKGSGSIRAGLLECNGLATFRGNIHADKIRIDGLVSVTGGTKVEASEIACDGLLTIEGEVSADLIEADGSISANEIVGDRIVIRSHFRRFFMPKRSRISLIEATTVDLRGVVAQTVNGKDVSIGPDCHIENLDCSGSLYVSPRARVFHITGNYTMRND